MRRHRINTLTKRVIHGKLYSLQEETPNEARIVQILCALRLDLRFFDYIDCCYLEFGRLVVLDHLALSAGSYSDLLCEYLGLRIVAEHKPKAKGK